MNEIRTDVVVIGGGPVGLAATLMLARHGIRSVLLEQHPTTARHPKASAFNTRTMELLRELGLADEIYARTGPVGGVSFYTSLTGHKLGALAMTDDPEYLATLLASTPAPLSISSQIVLEALLRERADRCEAIDLRFGCRKTRLVQDDDGVTVTAVDRASDETFAVRATWAIACDGAASPTRKELGRELIGPPAFGHQINVYFEADIEALTGDTEHQALYWITVPDANGVIIGLGGDWKHWCLNFSYFPDRGEAPEDFDEARCLAKIRRALGSDTLAVNVLGIGAWTLCGQVIDEMRDGRVFFGGDAAHLNIPTGGFGFNTGMQEIHNLAWKLAWVVRGLAPEALLDSYQTERREIAVYNVERSRENAYAIRATGVGVGEDVQDADQLEAATPEGERQRRERSDAIAAQARHFQFLGQEIGFGYWDSALVTPDGSPHYVDEFAVADPVHSYVPNARPGARAPHCWLRAQDADASAPPLSVLDLFGTEFVLLTTAAPEEGPEFDVPMRTWTVGEPGAGTDLVDESGDFRRVYGLPDGGAVLVRPDGHVAWRGRGAMDSRTVQRALERSLAR